MRTSWSLAATAILAAAALAGCATDRERHAARTLPAPEVAEGTVIDVLDGSIWLDEAPSGGTPTNLALADDVELIAEDGTELEDAAILEGREVRVFYDVTGASERAVSRVEVLSVPTEPNGVFAPPLPPVGGDDAEPVSPADPVEPSEPDEPPIGPDLVPDPLP